jgi:hypothetical protein
MKFLRRILGILVMFAGLLGLLIALAGLVGLWMFKPTVVENVTTTVDTLEGSISTSQEVMTVTKGALGATVNSLDALSVMLASTAASVEATEPMLVNVNILMGESIPSILESATDSLLTAQQAAIVLDSTIQSLEAFQFLLSGVPLLSGFVVEAEQPQPVYNPEVSMAQSLGEIAATLEGLPPMLVTMAEDMDKADDNLETIRSSLVIMSDNVVLISGSLEEYEVMISQSQTSMDNLRPILTGLQKNLTPIVDGVAIGLTLFLLWLLAIQIVVFSQGWELYQGTAGRMEGGDDEVAADTD